MKGTNRGTKTVQTGLHGVKKGVAKWNP